MEISKKDWALFRSRLPEWQEKYMAHLLQGYAQLIACAKDAKDAAAIFWELDDRMKRDKKSPGVLLSPTRGNMLWDLAKMVNDGAVTRDDLEGFSEDVVDAVKLILSGWE